MDERSKDTPRICDLVDLSVAYSLQAHRRLARQESRLSGNCRVCRGRCHVFHERASRLPTLNRMELALIGVSHKTAPVEVRERLAFPSDKIRAALASLLEKTHAAEAMILSTCNRVEIVVAQGPDAQLVRDFICEYHQIP